MTTDIKSNLLELQDLLEQIDQKNYSKVFDELSGASIGQHIRHIIELYQCLINDYDSGFICYDNRKRDELIELDPNEASGAIDKILLQLNKEDKSLYVDYLFLSTTNQKIKSTYFRELLYNLEHSIHHQAIIKVVLRTLPSIELSEHFGVAPSTIRFRMSLNK